MAKTKRKLIKGGSQGSPFLLQERKKLLIKEVLDGAAPKELIDKYSKEWKCSIQTVRNYLLENHTIIKRYREREADRTISLHIERYEWFYKYFHDLKLDVLAKKALEYKEKLLGIVKDGVMSVEVNNTNEETEVEEDLYNFELLKEEDRKRLQQLLDKCKK